MDINTASALMQKILEMLKVDLSTVRTGRAMPSLVENIIVAAYGGTTRLKVMELAQVGASDSQTLVITPFDASIITEIQKAIAETGMGLNPVIDGQIIRISIPPLSQERREELVSLVNQKLEAGRIQVRGVRHEAMDSIKKQLNDKLITEDDVFRLEKEAQNLTDKTIAEIDSLGKRKEEELLTI